MRLTPIKEIKKKVSDFFFFMKNKQKYLIKFFLKKFYVCESMIAKKTRENVFF